MTVQNEMFTVFVEAGKALEELPKVKADFAAAQDLLSDANATLTHRDATIATLQEILAGVQSQNAKLEADLAQATFRERAAKEAVNAIRSLLVIADVPVAGDTLPIATASVDSIAALEPDVPTPSVTVDGSTHEAADTSNSGTQAASDGSEGKSATDPTVPCESSPMSESVNVTPPSTDANYSEDATSPSHKGQSDKNPTPNAVQSMEAQLKDAPSDVTTTVNADSPSDFYRTDHHKTPDGFEFAV